MSDAANVSTARSTLLEDYASLCLNPSFSDVIFLVRGEKIHAHKAILAHRNERFHKLFTEHQPRTTEKKQQISLFHTNPEAFRHLLKFIYTDTTTMLSSIQLTLDVLILARRFHAKYLAVSVVNKHKYLLDTKNVFFILNAAYDYNLEELRNECHLFMDHNSVRILSSDSFSRLTREAMIQTIQRDSFVGPEINIFKSVAKWCQRNNNDGTLISACVRLQLLTVNEIVAVVWPTKLVNARELLEAISEITGKSSRDLRFRVVSNADRKIPVVRVEEVGSEKMDIVMFSTGRNADAEKFVQHSINGSESFVISLNKSYHINHIIMMLDESDARYYSYYIQTSIDRKKWRTIIQYSRYACRSIQMLYFEQHVAEYIKIVGVRCSRKGSSFNMAFIGAFYKSKIPTIIHAVVCPETNVATPENNAIVLEGGNPNHLLNGVFKDYSYHHMNGNPNCLIVQLAQPYVLSSMRLLTFGNEDSRYSYFIDTSVDKSDWRMAIDRKSEQYYGWQDLRFDERVVVFIRITGTYSSKYRKTFFCAHFECPSEAKI